MINIYIIITLITQKDNMKYVKVNKVPKKVIGNANSSLYALQT